MNIIINITHYPVNYLPTRGGQKKKKTDENVLQGHRHFITTPTFINQRCNWVTLTFFYCLRL